MLEHRTEQERQAVGSDDADPAGADEHAGDRLRLVRARAVSGRCARGSGRRRLAAAARLRSLSRCCRAERRRRSRYAVAVPAG